MKKKLDHESMRAYFREGHTAKEVAERFDTSAGYAKKICRGIRSGNQYTNGLFDRDANAVRYINERTPGFEYAGNFTGLDGFVDLRCKKCGTVFKKSFVSVKQGTARCSVCLERDRKDRARQRDKERDERAEERMLYRQRRAREREANIVGHQLTMKECGCCGRLFVPRMGQKYCSIECGKRINNAIKKDRRIRGMKKVIKDKNITLQRLYERDGGRCYICGKVCDWNDYIVRDDETFIANNDYPSIDHIIPVSLGGLHSWDNVRLACRGCNSKKGNKIVLPC